MSGKKVRTLEELIREPKGHISYFAGQAFVLHVFWEVPDAEKANELLRALQGCATATKRDTPCVPTYFFRLAPNNNGISSRVRDKVRDHDGLMSAHKKIELGVPRGAVEAELRRKAIDPALLALDLDAQLPEALRVPSVAVECTELYLDERAFMLHAGSRDYLDSYGAVMNPALMMSKPTTVRLGTPTQEIIEKILEEMLKEQVAAVGPGCFLWRRPEAPVGEPLFLSLDVRSAPDGADGTADLSVPAEVSRLCTTCLRFRHPLRQDTDRVLLVYPELPWLTQPDFFNVLCASLDVIRGEAHASSGALSPGVVALPSTIIAQSGFSGHILHPLAHTLHCENDKSS